MAGLHVNLGRALLAFVRKLIALRTALPVLRRNRFFDGEFNQDVGVKDVMFGGITKVN